MKKIIYIIGIALFVSACADSLLEENPKAIATETFYNTAAEVEAAINAVYYNVGVSQLTNEINIL